MGRTKNQVAPAPPQSTLEDGKHHPDNHQQATAVGRSKTIIKGNDDDTNQSQQQHTEGTHSQLYHQNHPQQHHPQQHHHHLVGTHGLYSVIDRDDDDDHDPPSITDPYTYSDDDSTSLSDAYFMQQPSLPPPPPPPQQQQQPRSSTGSGILGWISYGSTTTSSSGHNNDNNNNSNNNNTGDTASMLIVSSDSDRSGRDSSGRSSSLLWGIGLSPPTQSGMTMPPPSSLLGEIDYDDDDADDDADDDDNNYNVNNYSLNGVTATSTNAEDHFMRRKKRSSSGSKNNSNSTSTKIRGGSSEKNKSRNSRRGFWNETIPLVSWRRNQSPEESTTNRDGQGKGSEGQSPSISSRSFKRRKNRSSSSSSKTQDTVVDPQSKTTSILSGKDNSEEPSYGGIVTQLEEGELSLATSPEDHHHHSHRLSVSSDATSSSERERAVEAIRGRPQPRNPKKNQIWLWLFVLQLLAVFGCASWYGASLLNGRLTTVTTTWEGGSNDNMAEDHTNKNNRSRRLQEHGQQDQQRYLLNLLSDASVLAPSSAPRSKPVPSMALSMENDVSGVVGRDSSISAALTSSSSGSSRKNNDVSKHLQDDDNIGQIDPTETTVPVPVREPSSSNVYTAKDYSPFPDDRLTIEFNNVMSLVLVSGIHSTVAAYLCFAFMLIVAKSLIPIMFISSLLLSLCWAVFGFTLAGIASDSDGDGESDGESPTDVPSYGISLISLFGLASFVLTVGYTVAAWKHVGFWSTNLYVAISGIRGCLSVLLIGIGALFVALGWVMVWTLAVVGILNSDDFADCTSWGDCGSQISGSMTRNSPQIIGLSFMVISFVWTVNVIRNTVSVAVSQRIGTWWNTPASDNPVTMSPLPSYYGRQKLGRSACCNRPTRRGSRHDHQGDEWESSERRSCCSPRADATTYSSWDSFGTVCFGSFVVVPAQVLCTAIGVFTWLFSLVGTCDGGSNDHKKMRMSASSATASSDVVDDQTNIGPSNVNSEISNLIPQKMIHSERSNANCWTRLNRTLLSCNRWAFTYVGIYNYSFLEGGEKAIQLFETREWMDVVKDSLVENILLIGSVLIGGSTGAVAVVVEEVDGYMFTSLHQPVVTSFWIGFLLGFVLSNVLLRGLVGSAVNTVLVCFAAEPFAFDRNHPQLSREMREVWSQQVWEPTP